MAAANTDKFKKAKRRFSTTIAAGGFAQGATTLPLTSTTGLDTDTAITLVLDPGGSAEEVITGVVSGSNVINCVRGKEGTTDQVHNAGDAVGMYFTETHWDDLIDGVLAQHKQTGAHSTITADSITTTSLTVTGTATSQGWTALGQTPNTITANGNRNFDLVFNSVDLTSTLSPGMKLQLSRTVAAPDQCADLEASSSQYFSKTSPAGLSFTTTFTCSAWVKLESYTLGGIIARRNADTEGWSMYVNGNGQLVLEALRIASNNKLIASYASLPLNKWVHVTATMDVAAGDTTAQKIWFDGVEVARSYTLTGTCAALVQGTTALVVGAIKSAGTNPFDGKIAQAAVFSSQLSDATVKAMMDRTLSGAESGCVSAFSLDNSLNDLNANANNLTANGGAAATATDSPFANAVAAGTLEYAEINTVTFSTNTTVNVRVPDTCQIPSSGGVSAVNYSTQVEPYGLPYFSKVLASTLLNVSATTTTTGSHQDIPGFVAVAYIPTGAQVRLKLIIPRFAGSAGGAAAAAIKEGSTVLVNNVVNYTAAFDVCMAQIEGVTYPSAGSHTYKVSFGMNSAMTLTLYGGIGSSYTTATSAVLLVELA